MQKQYENLLSLILFTLTLVVLLFIPFKILSYGYLPYDDALRHCAKIFSQKKWTEILVIREDMFLDSHPGWEFILSRIQSLFNMTVEQLVSCSIVVLSYFVLLVPLLSIKRIESYLIAFILIIAAYPSWVQRIMIGRPLVLSIFFIIFFSLNWNKFLSFKSNKKYFAILFLISTLTAWIHCQWFLLLIPAFAFLLTGRVKPSLLLSTLILASVFVGFSFTLQPIEMFKQTSLHLIRSVMHPSSQEMLVPEFKAVYGDFNTVLLILVVLFFKHAKASETIKKIQNDPLLIMIAVFWVLSHKVNRFWIDWGLPCSLAWLTLQFDELFCSVFKERSIKRYFLLISVSISLFIIFTADINGRFSESSKVKYLNMEKPIPEEWLPEKNGILYSDMTSAFNWTFFKYPKGNWKYILGFEASLMPEEDLKILYDIQKNPGQSKYYLPWIQKMNPADRIFLVQYYFASPPEFTGMEWFLGPENTWIGRKK